MKNDPQSPFDSDSTYFYILYDDIKIGEGHDKAVFYQAWKAE